MEGSVRIRVGEWIQGDGKEGKDEDKGGEEKGF